MNMIDAAGVLKIYKARGSAPIHALAGLDLAVPAGTVKGFSGGMRRRLDLAGALVINPKVPFLDEPTTGLDPHSRLSLWEVIKNLVAAGTALLLTTQYLEEADQLADDIAVIDDGTVIAEGTADQLKARIGGHRVEIALVDAAGGAADSGPAFHSVNAWHLLIGRSSTSQTPRSGPTTTRRHCAIHCIRLATSLRTWPKSFCSGTCTCTNG